MSNVTDVNLAGRAEYVNVLAGGATGRVALRAKRVQAERRPSPTSGGRPTAEPYRASTFTYSLTYSSLRGVTEGGRP